MRHALANHTALPYNQLMEFIKATAFTKYLYYYLSEEEYLGLQSFLLQYPESGKIVRGTGGVRKVRWAMSGKGKSGGVRVIYYFKRQDDEIWLLTIYSKNEVENIPAHVLRQIAKEIENV
jgi:mRNA-degrading endonuclease RelE of RelBE toxin-antitoxin system